MRFLRVLALALVPSAPLAAQSIATTYQATANRLITASLADQEGYSNLQYLCDHIGNRITGSDSLAKAVTWSADTMRRLGLQNVTVQPVTVPHWVRGAESGSINTPISRPLHLLGLGESTGTPQGGITAPVVVVPDFAALDKLGRNGISGRIVVYNAPYTGYGATVQYRVFGASRAAAYGAVAVLVRSITPLAMQTPHTGTMVYDKALPKIPAAAITIEDALLLDRLTAEGRETTVHLEMGAHMEADAQSANVFGEIPGREHPDQIVAVGGHLDSWDVGQGAQDDGSGIMAALAAVNVIRKVGLTPRRTLRVVFWVSEENGGAGGRAYRDALGSNWKNHVAAIEMDGGAETPVGYGYGSSGLSIGRLRTSTAPGITAPPVKTDLSDAESHSLQLLHEIGGLLYPVGASQMTAGGGGSDIAPLMQAGVPGLDERTTGAHYFDWHHTEADTLDKVDPVDFRKNVASLAVMSYILADMPETLAGHPGAGEE